MAFPTKFPHTINYRTEKGQITQQITMQGENDYTVKTWVHPPAMSANEICNASGLSKSEAVLQIDYQEVFANDYLENIATVA